NTFRHRYFIMNEKQLHALAAEFAKNLKTPEDLNQFSRMLKKITVEAALNDELTDHLGYLKRRFSFALCI
ncbi:hypothetical protein NUS62_12055, partial [Glaesserella parasuis]|nr:hypothetical protein [Glaesserella parasuis]